MAGADLNLSRRALLGAACAAPVAAVAPANLLRHPGLDPGSTFSLVNAQEGRWTPDQVRGDGERGTEALREKRLARWNAALARFRRAEAALAVADGADEDRFGRLASRCDAAMCRLLRTPAPDAAALALKLELTIRHLVWELTGGDVCLAPLVRDARRLVQARG